MADDYAATLTELIAVWTRERESMAAHGLTAAVGHATMAIDALTAGRDALLAAVRAEHGLTVVKLRDDETWPVASACAIAGACQWGR